MPARECTLPDSPVHRLALAHLDAAGAVAADHLLARDGRIYVVLTDDEVARLAADGLPVEVGEPLRTRAERADTGVDALTTGFVSGYLDGEEVATELAAFAAAHPGLCTLSTLPFPTSGYDGSFAPALGPASVLLLRITTTPASASKPGFLLIAGTHAREWLNPLIALEFAGQLLANYDPTSTDPDVQAMTALVGASDVFVVAALNPDGLTYSVHDDAGWRKNRRVNGGGCAGVDNNRNYEVYFGGAGSSGNPCSDTYRGPSAMSEPENRNVRWVLEQFPNILVGVDAHSYGQLVLRPNPAGGSFTPSEPVSAADEAVYAGLETTLQTAIQAVNGNVYGLGTTSNHAGPSDEYLFFAHRAFGFNTECGTSFQPPWAQALPVITEVVAGLRALLGATVALTTTTPTPLSVVQCIDRTGSMVAFGYEEPARQNAKRFTDLLSLGDSTAVVSFADPSPGSTPVADRARVEVPLTLLAGPGDAAGIRTAIDAIAFGGATPIGAGLQASADQLGAAPAPHAVLLVSDGYNNVPPDVPSALATLPAGLRVYTVALGPAADAALLQGIATSTGALFLPSPTALDLHQAYNDMRAGITDDGLVANDVLDAARPERWVTVEPAADRLLVTASAPDGKLGRMVLTAPSGRPVRSDDWGVSSTRQEGYTNVLVDRPEPGRWRVRLAAEGAVVGVFVASPLHLDLDLPAAVKGRETVRVQVAARFEDHPLADPRLVVRSRTVPLRELPPDLDPDDKDPARLRAWLARHRPGQEKELVWDTDSAHLPRGWSVVTADVHGRLPGGSRFFRTVRRAVRVR